MSKSGRFLVNRSPKQRSFLKSLIFFSLLLTGGFFSAAYLRGDLKEVLRKNLPRVKPEEILIRENKNKNSISTLLNSKIPNLCVVGIYKSGNSLFYHDFLEVASEFESHLDLKLLLANIDIKHEADVLEEYLRKYGPDGLSYDRLPVVLFYFKGKEIEEFRLELEFTNLIREDLKKGVSKLLNYKFNQINK